MPNPRRSLRFFVRESRGEIPEIICRLIVPLAFLIGGLVGYFQWSVLGAIGGALLGFSLGVWLQRSLRKRSGKKRGPDDGSHEAGVPAHLKPPPRARLAAAAKTLPRSDEDEAYPSPESNSTRWPG
jgi:hypothetical protein